MSLCISRALLDEILADARAGGDRERCGLLLGRGGEILGHVPSPNVAPDPRRQFELDPAALIAAHRHARSGGPVVLGHYHFHPVGDARPSPADAAAAHGDGQYWLIVTVQHWRLWQAVAGGEVLSAFIPAELVLASA